MISDKIKLDKCKLSHFLAWQTSHSTEKHSQSGVMCEVQVRYLCFWSQVATCHLYGLCHCLLQSQGKLFSKLLSPSITFTAWKTYKSDLTIEVFDLIAVIAMYIRFVVKTMKFFWFFRFQKKGNNL